LAAKYETPIFNNPFYSDQNTTSFNRRVYDLVYLKIPTYYLPKNEDPPSELGLPARPAESAGEER